MVIQEVNGGEQIFQEMLSSAALEAEIRYYDTATSLHYLISFISILSNWVNYRWPESGCVVFLSTEPSRPLYEPSFFISLRDYFTSKAI